MLARVRWRGPSAPPYVIDQLVGHELEKGTAGGYGVGVGMRELAKAIVKVDPLKG